MKKFNFKAGLYFGLVMTMITVVQSMIGSTEITGQVILKTVLISIVSGTFGGILFGFFMGYIATSKRVANTANFEPDENESIVFQSPANYEVGVEKVGGMLYLTERRLVFKPHSFNIQKQELSLSLTEIISASQHSNLGILKNGLTIQVENDVIYKFVIDPAEKWVKLLS